MMMRNGILASIVRIRSLRTRFEPTALRGSRGGSPDPRTETSRGRAPRSIALFAVASVACRRDPLMSDAAAWVRGSAASSSWRRLRSTVNSSVRDQLPCPHLGSKASAAQMWRWHREPTAARRVGWWRLRSRQREVGEAQSTTRTAWSADSGSRRFGVPRVQLDRPLPRKAVARCSGVVGVAGAVAIDLFPGRHHGPALTAADQARRRSGGTWAVACRGVRRSS